ncbi:hypothetical protein UFOVP75_17 [uncultured Caudovirales phage]|uniref:Uncharacterized protein n=1 Tax=uncultured Caudovirales phage TaxID=2100421 RepID=A0A6J5KW17_9CAUD|nr:hypothetical protein UFOVP75_17 [uncultured Caudovirales phage]
MVSPLVGIVADHFDRVKSLQRDRRRSRSRLEFRRDEFAELIVVEVSRHIERRKIAARGINDACAHHAIIKARHEHEFSLADHGNDARHSGILVWCRETSSLRG